MPLKPITGSSALSGYHYDPKSKVLEVQFTSGGTYRYSGIMPGVVRSVMRAKSKGKMFHKKIKKGGYEYEKVSAEKCCKCNAPATVKVLWCEGRAYQPACEAHKEKVADVFRNKPQGDDFSGFKKIAGLKDLADAGRLGFDISRLPLGTLGDALKGMLTGPERLHDAAIAAGVLTLPAAVAGGAYPLGKHQGQKKHANDPIKKKVEVQGVPIWIEWKKGETRLYKDHKTGEVKYKRLMTADYGYIPETKDADGEEIDVYLGADYSSKKAFVIKQLKKSDRSFDENKVMIGYPTEKAAKDSYMHHMSACPECFGGIHEVPVSALLALFGENGSGKEKVLSKAAAATPMLFGFATELFRIAR